MRSANFVKSNQQPIRRMYKRHTITNVALFLMFLVSPFGGKRKMKFKFLAVMCLAALLALLAVSVGAQDMPTPSVAVGDQAILGGFVTIDSIYSEGPGFVVIHRGSDGGVVGVSQPLNAGWTNNLRIPI